MEENNKSTWAEEMFKIAQNNNSMEKRARNWLKRNLIKEIDPLRNKIHAEAYKGNTSVRCVFNTRFTRKDFNEEEIEEKENDIISVLEEHSKDFLNCDKETKLEMFTETYQELIKQYGLKIEEPKILESIFKIPTNDVEIEYIISWDFSNN